MASIEKLSNAKQYSSVAIKTSVKAENAQSVYGIDSPQKKKT
jgi:hypothetical protein